jgi:tetratricopeptide (TPR) repeat protein
MISRRDVGFRGTVLALIAAGFVTSACAGEDPRTALSFLQGLKDRGLHELAVEYIGQLRSDTSLPENIKAVLDYEEARTLIDEAARSNDLIRREELLRDARDKLDGFVKAHPDLRQSRDALVQKGKLMLERGYVAMMLSEELTDPAKKQAKVAEARAAFTEARAAYATAVEPLEAVLKKFAAFIEKNDPRAAERDAVYSTMLDAKLQQGVADYELAQTFPAGSADRAKGLKTAREQFESLYKGYRGQWAGLAAQMWQAKCFEEEGNVGPAVAIYKELLGHTEPRLRELQRHVGYFYIVALSKRKQHALAADEASRWLNSFNSRDDRRSAPGLGVQLELAKNIDAQMPEVAANERSKAVERIVDAASQVVRFASPYKKEALALLKKYRPGTAIRAEELARLSYEDVMAKAEEARGSQEWGRAIGLFQAAIRKADPSRDVNRANRARHELALCFYMAGRFYEAYVLEEHLARRYPQGGVSPIAGAVAMQAMADAYNANEAASDRVSDLDRLVDIATYTAETWPDREQGDDARMNLGLIALGRGKYDDAIKVLGSVRPKSRQWASAQNRLGAAHWAKSRDLDRKGDTAAAQAETKTAVDLLNATAKALRDGGAGPEDPALVGNIADLATILTETGKPAESLALLEPAIKAQTVKSGAAFSRMMEAQLKAFIASGKIQPAIDSMRALEQAGGAAGRAQLYYRLGSLLEKELDRLREKGNTKELTALQQAYKTFLTTLVESKTGQSYESLQWAGEALLTLDAFQDAEKVFRRVLNDFTQDPKFLQQAGGRERLLNTRIKLAAALRGQKKFDEAGTIVDDLLKDKQNQRDGSLAFEKGLLLEARAEARKGTWAQALKYWEDVAKKSPPRSVLYYDAWYHVALALSKDKSTTKARQTLLGVMRLSPSVGSPEMKAKYQGLLARIH